MGFQKSVIFILFQIDLNVHVSTTGHQVTFCEVTDSGQKNILESINAPKREEVLPLRRNFAFLFYCIGCLLPSFSIAWQYCQGSKSTILSFYKYVNIHSQEATIYCTTLCFTEGMIPIWEPLQWLSPELPPQRLGNVLLLIQF